MRVCSSLNALAIFSLVFLFLFTEGSARTITEDIEVRPHLEYLYIGGAE